MKQHPYSLSNAISRRDIRQSKWREQRKKRGFDDTELWNLDSTIAKFVLPRLKAFKKLKGGRPYELSNDEWDDILDKMICSFSIIAKDSINADYELYQEGLDLFAKYFGYLWD